MLITPMEMSTRIAASVVLGALVGYQRERAGRPAGLRTHLLVCLASATFMLVSSQFVYYQHYQAGDLVTTDPSRIAASVVSGVGFLGAGAILRTGLSIQGLTTAASLWLVAAVGLASGAGMFAEAVSASLIALFSLVILRRIEKKQWTNLRRTLRVSIDEDGIASTDLLERLEAMGGLVRGFDIDRNLVAKRTGLRVDVSFADHVAEKRLIEQLEALPGVRRVRLESNG